MIITHSLNKPMQNQDPSISSAMLIVVVYNKLQDQLVKAGKLDEAKLFFDMMVMLKMDDEAYKFIMMALSEAGRLDQMLKIVDDMLDDDRVRVSEEMQEFVKEELRKGGREGDLEKLIEEKERLKAEAKAKELEEAEVKKKSQDMNIAQLIKPKAVEEKKKRQSCNGKMTLVVLKKPMWWRWLKE